MLITAQEEQLYQQYLRARVEQQQEDLQIAKQVLTEDPENNICQEKVEEIRMALQRSIAELSVQSKILAEASHAASSAKNTISRITHPHTNKTIIAKPPVDPITRSTKAPAPAKNITRKNNKHAPLPPAMISQLSKLAKKSRQQAQPVANGQTNKIAQAIRNTAALISNSTAATMQPQRTHKKTATASRPMTKRTATAVLQTQPAASPKPADISKTANTSFKTAQATKASTIMRLAMKVIEAGEKRNEPAKRLKMELQKKNPAISKPKPTLHRRKNVCPHCTAPIQPGENICLCGHDLSASGHSAANMGEVSGLVLDEADRILLDGQNSVTTDLG